MQSSLGWYDQAALGAYRAVQAADDPEQRVLAHASMVKRVALHLRDRVGGELDDLIQDGMVGLLEAALRYDSSTGVPFEAFALPRVRGAMVDQRRRDDWCPRPLRRRGQDIRLAAESFTQRHGRNPNDSELAEDMSLSVTDLQDVRRRLEPANLCSLEWLLESGLELVTEGDDPSQESLVRQQLQQRLAKLLSDLSEREQQILYLYYQKEMNLREIVAVLDISEARICQIRKKGLATLRQSMSQWQD